MVVLTRVLNLKHDLNCYIVNDFALKEIFEVLRLMCLFCV